MRRLGRMLCVIGLVLCLAACGEKVETVIVCGTPYTLDTTELELKGVDAPEVEAIARLSELTYLDLRNTGITTAEFDTLRQALPDCHIVWSVPFQNGYLDSDTRTLTVTTLSATDVKQLDYLPELAVVDGTDCPDVEVLYDLSQRRPDCQVSYHLTVQGVDCSLDAQALTLPTVTQADLTLLRKHIPTLENLTLTQLQQEPQALLDLMEANPDLVFHWETEIEGVLVDAQAEFLDFSDIAIEDLESLEAVVTRLPNLTQVDMCRCGISNEDMDALNRRHENILFVWEIDFGHVQYRTDISWFMPCQDDLWLTNSNSVLLNYFTELECLDLGHNHINDCSFVANMPKLRYLLLGDTFISDITPLEGLENVVYLEIFMTRVRDYTPILTLKNLEVLNLSYTQGDPDVVAQMTWVDYIRWVNYEDKSISFARKDQLRQELPNTLLELEIGTSSTGGMWRKTQHYFDMRDMVGMYYMTG